MSKAVGFGFGTRHSEWDCMPETISVLPEGDAVGWGSLQGRGQ